MDQRWLIIKWLYNKAIVDDVEWRFMESKEYLFYILLNIHFSLNFFLNIWWIFFHDKDLEFLVLNDKNQQSKKIFLA